ncbi:hypothetical protein [Spirochaeta isovalerica]|uniref:Uncharacterized protein n=1 Tax=Spirochaeta isovalerica TaxID=150 RepID=A0A841R0V7_9SPIO|nr:hypothetical protein [Spirochaeta isovalerica]MBB6478584.1 hypothetical protein [Spirochaeta isovalerica]
MKIPEKLPDLFISGIEELSIDASSIIYMLKIGIFGYAAAEITFFACPCILEEVGWPGLPVNIVPEPQEIMTNDETVLYVSRQKNIPLMSEDLEILAEADKKSIPYFNTLMILNYLLLRGRVTRKEYPEYYERLKEISRYSREVLDYGEKIRILVEHTFYQKWTPTPKPNE